MISKFKHIAWDVDDTLIGHENSPKFWEYILYNPHNQVHHIVTFRSGGYEDYIFEDLQRHGSSLIRDNFDKIINISHEAWLSFKTRKLIVDISQDPYTHWKGEMCANHGFDVLIDDATDLVKYGCLKYNIPLFHPDELGDL